MSKTFSTIFGLGLIALWVVGISTVNVTGWLLWLDGIVGVCATIMGLAMDSESSRNVRVGGPVTIALCLFALWIIGLFLGATSWLSWWTLGFACAFLIPGIASTPTPTRPHHPMTA